MKKQQVVILILIIAAGFALRISGIGFGLPSKNMALTTYNPDEALTFYTLEAMNPSKLDFNPRRAFLWGGLSIYMTGAGLKIAQVFKIVRPESREFLIANLHEADKLYIVARLIPVFFGTVSLLLIFLLIKKAFGETEGLIASAILALIPAHIINSFYVRPDVIMLAFVLLSMILALDKKYLLSGLIAGLGAATKLNGAVFAVFPLILLISDKNYRRLPVFILFCFAGFVIGCPYSIIDFKGFYMYIAQNMTLAKGSMNPGQAAFFGPGALSYLTYYLPHAAGIPLLILGFAGFVFCILRRGIDRILAVTGLIVYLASSATSNQVVWYTIPVLPFLAFFSARFAVQTSEYLRDKRVQRAAFVAIIAAVLGYTTVYSAANLSLYTSKNTRENASEWIVKNIPQGSKIAIARSYFWTPPVLRQYKPPYKLIMGGDIQSTPDVYIPGLRPAAAKADYVVLSEFEYRDYTHPKIKTFFPEQTKIFEEIMNGTKFEKVAEFDREARFAGITFAKNYPPGDWLLPNPKIIIYKRGGKK